MRKKRRISRSTWFEMIRALVWHNQDQKALRERDGVKGIVAIS